MGRRPTKAADNSFCQARLAAAQYNERLKSKEGAAEMLGISVSTLSDYELGLTKIVPPDMVLKMADLYNAPELRNYYCREVCPLGGDVPVLELEDLDRITVRAMASLRNVAAMKESLLDITADGVISEEEKPELRKILATLDEISAIAQSLKVWTEKNLE
ncbi:XRE family transcriptional regulator [bacterium D16-50]|nr:XRE family transcriptional regulator [bacterium D16-50]